MNENQSTRLVQRATSEIEDNTNALQTQIDILHENLTTLENILLPVTKPYGEGKQGQSPSVGAVEESLSPIGDRIRTARRQIANTNERIDALKGKLAI